MTSLILQYRANSGMCSHRSFGPSNQTQFNGGWVYTSDVALHEWLLRGVVALQRAAEVREPLGG